MPPKRVSVAGACGLLGQHLLVRLLESSDFVVESLHDPQADQGVKCLADASGWQGLGRLHEAGADLPLLPAAAPATAPLLLSFLPDSIGQDVEARHLARGTRVISHCEYARVSAPLIMPGVSPEIPAEPLLGTPNCTTAMCAPPLFHLHRAFGVTDVTITTLQAISGTDLPGMPASAIHDQVIGHLPEEADALSTELARLLDDAFPVYTFATRVPVWRGHTITLSIGLSTRPGLEAIKSCLSAVPDVKLTPLQRGRDHFGSDTSVSHIVNVRETAAGVSLVIQGDNLGPATVGVMHTLALKT